jgi:hypothetical protein
MSHRALDMDRTSHCGDLESVYYLLCFIIGCHTELDISMSQLAISPHPFDDWMHTSISKVARYKEGYIERRRLGFQVQEVFKPLERLATNLHLFLHVRVHASIGGHQRKGDIPCSPLSAEHDFTEFLDLFNECIEEMMGGPRNQRLEEQQEDGIKELFNWISGRKRVLTNNDPKTVSDRDIKRSRTM